MPGIHFSSLLPVSVRDTYRFCVPILVFVIAGSFGDFCDLGVSEVKLYRVCSRYRKSYVVFIFFSTKFYRVQRVPWGGTLGHGLEHVLLGIYV